MGESFITRRGGGKRVYIGKTQQVSGNNIDLVLTVSGIGFRPSAFVMTSFDYSYDSLSRDRTYFYGFAYDGNTMSYVYVNGGGNTHVGTSNDAIDLLTLNDDGFVIDMGKAALPRYIKPCLLIAYE